MRNLLAFDIGASNGRAILGQFDGERISMRELHRFAPDAPLRPDTLYFGGGTPSLLTPAQAERLIRAADPVPGAETVSYTHLTLPTSDLV